MFKQQAWKENVIKVYDKGEEFTELCSGGKRAKTSGFWLPVVHRVHFKVLLSAELLMDRRLTTWQTPSCATLPMLCVLVPIA